MDTRTTIRLDPLYGGAYTRLRLCAFVPTPLPGWALRRLCSLLTLFSGHPVRFALSVDDRAVPWSELWTASITELPDNCCQTSFIIRRRNDHGGSARSPG